MFPFEKELKSKALVISKIYETMIRFRNKLSTVQVKGCGPASSKSTVYDRMVASGRGNFPAGNCNHDM